MNNGSSIQTPSHAKAVRAPSETQNMHAKYKQTKIYENKSTKKEQQNTPKNWRPKIYPFKLIENKTNSSDTVATKTVMISKTKQNTNVSIDNKNTKKKLFTTFINPKTRIGTHHTSRGYQEPNETREDT